MEKKDRGLASLLTSGTKVQDNAVKIKSTRGEKDWVRVGVLMTLADCERYRNFFWFMKNKSGNSHWGHKELQNHIMNLMEEKYGKIPERSDAEKEFENGKKGRK